MGYTHFDKVSGANGVAVGAKGSEVRIDEGNMLLSFTSPAATTVASSYLVVPYDMKLVAAYVDLASGTTGTGVAVTIFQDDTAGTALFGSVAIASAGTPGATTYTAGTMSTATITALSSIAIHVASSGTACGLGITIVGTKVS